MHDAVGGHPEESGSEETHRPTAKDNPAPGSGSPGAAKLSRPRRQRLAQLLAGRLRLQAAGLVTVLAILLIALAFPSREVHIITSDGEELSVNSRSSNAVSAVEQAGITLEPGDEVRSIGDSELLVDRATEAVLRVDGQAFALRTQAATIDELLVDANIALEQDDSVLRDEVYVSPSEPVEAPLVAASGGGALPNSGYKEPVTVEVRRAVPFALVENGQELQLRSSMATVATALSDVGVRLGPGDEVQPSPDTQMTAGLQVRVEHAQRLVVTLPEGKKILYALAGSVDDALIESGIGLPADYRLEPAGETAIGPGLTVHVIGISKDQVIETERIESYTVYEPDASLAWGQTRTVAGQDGVHYLQYVVRYEDGVTVDRELAGDWYDPLPVDTIVYYSTAAEPTFTAATALDWRELVCSYNWDCDWALAVISCESGGNPDAYNPAGPFIGLFQIWQGHGSNLTDPAVNIAAAYSLYLSGGAGHWPNCP